ncbi:MAG: META domain-containing protein [Anaerolineales bacterium]|nr:META domain-containing protein [Anaerolineales bacterium]
MKKNISLLMFIMLIASVLLAACADLQPEVSESSTEDDTTTSGSESMPAETAVADNVVTWYIGPNMVDCEGEGPQKCLLVKENPEDDYLYFYSNIEGFEYEEGYEYEIRVLQEPVENPPAGGSSIKYTLVEVVDKQPATAEGTNPDAPQGEVVTWYIGPNKVECTGVGPQECLLIKENPNDDYSLFYDNIEGFEYEAGNTYEIRVLIAPVENPPADGSSLSYTLVEIVDQQPATAEEENTLWHVVEYRNRAGEMVGVLPGSEITALFQSDRVAGNASCNTYFASYTLDGNTITVDPNIGSTMMFCAPEELMEQEAVYLARLSMATTFEDVNDQLHIFDENGEIILIFETVESAPLTNTVWQLTLYNNGKEALVSAIAGTEITAIFGNDGNLSGSASCNTYNAAYTVDDQNITIGPSATTMMFCGEPEGIMDQESAYLAAIETAVTFTITGDELELLNDQGTRVAIYVAASAPVEDETEAATSDLTGIVWKWLELTTPVEQTIVDNPENYTIEFMQDGTASIKADCNNVTANYTAADGNITITLGATTLAMCPPESLSDQYLSSLIGAAIYFFDGDNLLIDLQFDSGTMKFGQ